MCVCLQEFSHPLLPLRALVHECEEVEVRRVRLGLTGLDKTPDVAVDPGSGAALDQIGLVCIGAVPQLLRGRPHSSPLGQDEHNKQEGLKHQRAGLRGKKQSTINTNAKFITENACCV